jgi:hypothetical protein
MCSGRRNLTSLFLRLGRWRIHRRYRGLNRAGRVAEWLVTDGKRINRRELEEGGTLRTTKLRQSKRK